MKVVVSADVTVGEDGTTTVVSVPIDVLILVNAFWGLNPGLPIEDVLKQILVGGLAHENIRIVEEKKTAIVQ